MRMKLACALVLVALAPGCMTWRAGAAILSDSSFPTPIPSTRLVPHRRFVQPITPEDRVLTGKLLGRVTYGPPAAPIDQERRPAWLRVVAFALVLPILLPLDLVTLPLQLAMR